jgi:hypothetical protein
MRPPRSATRKISPVAGPVGISSMRQHLGHHRRVVGARAADGDDF